jgi:hypothetical protein
MSDQAENAISLSSITYKPEAYTVRLAAIRFEG